MKLFYVVFGLGKKKVSITDKIFSQIRELNNLGIAATGFFFTNEVSEKEEIGGNVICFPLQKNKPRKYFNNFFQTQENVLQAIEILKNELPEDAIVYLRYPGAGYGFFSLLKYIGHKMVLFIPSNTIRESYIERKFAEDGSLGSRLFRWIEYFFFIYLQEKLLYWFHASKIRLLTTFTPEFTEIMRKKFRAKVTCVYNGDGTNTDAVKLRTPLTNTGAKVKLLFMKGSSTSQYWSGLPRLINSINNGFENKFELYIAGKTHGEAIYQHPFVKLLGVLSREELDTLCNSIDLGVSNLANYLIHFNQVTNMKSREYYARGLPFIQSNTMPDITGKPEDRFFLCLPNDASLIDMNVVYDFAINMRNEVNHPKEMRIFAENNLDWKIKMKELKGILYSEFQQEN